MTDKFDHVSIKTAKNGYFVRLNENLNDGYFPDMYVFNSLDDLFSWLRNNLENVEGLPSKLATYATAAGPVYFSSDPIKL